MYFLNDFEIVPVASIITGITFVFTFHMRCISVVSSLYFIFSASFLITFLSSEIATSINILVPFIIITIIIIIIAAIELSLGGSSPYTSTDKTYKNKYTYTKQHKTQYKQYNTQ